MVEITFKYRRETDKEYAHTAIFVDGFEVGYYMKNLCWKKKGENIAVILEKRPENVEYSTIVSNKKAVIEFLNSVFSPQT